MRIGEEITRGDRQAIPVSVSYSPHLGGPRMDFTTSCKVTLEIIALAAFVIGGFWLIGVVCG